MAPREGECSTSKAWDEEVSSSGFSAPTKLVKADRGKRSDKGEAGRERECQRQHRLSQRERYQQYAKQGINHAQENGMAGHRGKIIETAPERLQQIGRSYAADDRACGGRARAEENV